MTSAHPPIFSPSLSASMNKSGHHIKLGLTGLVILTGYILLIRSGESLWDSYKSYDLLSQKLERLDQGEMLKKQKALEIKTLKASLSRIQPAGKRLRSHLDFVAYAERLCRVQKLSITGLPQEEKQQWQGYEISEEKLSVEGQLSNILRMIYQIEYLDRVASISQATLERKTIRQHGKPRHLLLAHLSLRRLNTTEK